MPSAPPSDDRRTSFDPKVLAALAAGFAALTLPALPVLSTSPGGTIAAPLGLAATAVLGAALAVLSAIDIATRRLPDVLTLPLAAAGLALAPEVLGTSHLWHAAGAMCGFMALWAVAQVYLMARGRHGLGLGDAKLLAAGGAWGGLEALPAVVLAASLSGLAVALWARWRGADIRAETALPFGPFLALGIWLVWLYGPLV